MANAERILAKAERLAKEYGDSWAGMSDDSIRTARLGFHVGVLTSEIKSLCSQLSDYLTPATGRNEHETTWSGEFAEYVIHYDFSAADDEVGQADDVTINGVYLNGTDVQGELSEKTMALIEEHCIEAANEAIRDAQIDAAEDRAKRMREERWAA
jgi:hypothetical protein